MGTAGAAFGMWGTRETATAGQRTGRSKGGVFWVGVWGCAGQEEREIREKNRNEGMRAARRARDGDERKRKMETGDKS